MNRYVPPQEDIITWCLLLERAFHEMRATDPGLQSLYLAPGLVDNLVYSFLVDINKYNLSHGITLPDRHKIAGFIAKWIAFARPVQYPQDEDWKETSKSRQLANEVFATLVALQYILKIRPNTVPPKIHRHLVYSFKYRYFTARNLALLFYTIEQIESVEQEILS